MGGWVGGGGGRICSERVEPSKGVNETTGEIKYRFKMAIGCRRGGGRSRQVAAQIESTLTEKGKS